MKYELEYKKVIEVEFLTPEKTLDFFLNSDWKDTFFEFNDLQDVSEHIGYCFANFNPEIEEIDGEYLCVYDLEGFPYFVSEDVDARIYVSSHGDTGEIVVKITQDLELDYCNEEE